MSKRTPPAWAYDTAKAFNALWHNRRKEIEGAVTSWTAWERRHLHDDDKPAMPEAARLGYACAVMIGTVNKVAADSPESLAMLTGLESAPVPDGLAGVCLAAVAPDGWPASEREILEAWGRVDKAFAENRHPDAPRMSAVERGRQKAKVTNPRDRELIRDEVKRISELSGMTQKDACIEVCEQAKNRMIRGKRVLSTTYHLEPPDVRRIFLSNW